MKGMSAPAACGATAFLVLAAVVGTTTVAAQGQDAAVLLEAKYRSWVESLPQTPSPNSLFDPDAIYDRNTAFQEIVQLGLPAVPAIVAELEKGERPGLEYALHRITRWAFHYGRKLESPGHCIWFIEEYPDMEHRPGPPLARDVTLRWWRQGRRETPERFAALYADWKTLKAEGKDKEATEKYERIKDLGIDALPLIVQQVQSGNTDLIPIMSYLTDNESPATATPEQCVSWWEANKAKWTLPSPDPIGQAATTPAPP